MSQPSSAAITSAVRRATPGIVFEPGERVGVRHGERSDLAIAGRDGAGEQDVEEVLVEQEAVMGGDAPGERLGEGRALCGAGAAGRGPPAAPAPSPAISARIIARAHTPSTVVTTFASLMFAVSRTFWTRFASRARSPCADSGN